MGTRPTTSTYDWQLERPCSKDFSLWKRCISCLVTGTNHLNYPVGKWIRQPHMIWKWFYCLATQRIYEDTKEGWIVYRRSTDATRSNDIYITSGGFVPRPEHLDYTTVSILSRTLVRFEGFCTSLTTDPLPLPFTTPTHSFWILKDSNITAHAHSDWVYRGLLQGTLKAVCDGSFQPKLIGNGMSTSWIIESADGHHKLEGSCCIADDAADAYRAELLGIYAIITAIYFVEQSTAQQLQGTLHVGCDNEQAGYKSMIDDPKVSITHKHVDLLKAIRRLRQLTTTTISSFHIYGHQDAHTSYHNLSRAAQLNVQVDKMAQCKLIDAFDRNTFIPQPTFPQEGYQLWLNGRKIQCNVRANLRRYIGHRNLRQYLYNKGLIAWNTYPMLDWDTLRKFMDGQSQPFQLWYTKHWTNFCAIGKMMKRIKLWNSDLCPCCRQVPENSTTHLFLCPHPLIVARRDSSFKAILTWMADTHTDPGILHLVSSLWYARHPSFTSDDPQYLVDMWNVLQDIGTQSMWMGLIPVIMTQKQNDYFCSMGLKKSGSKWAKQLIGKCLRATLQLWLQRNEILHLQTEEGVNGMHLQALYTAVEEELDRGLEGLQHTDFHLLQTNIHRLRLQPIESIRGWLCSVKIARNDFDGARQESVRDRGWSSHQQPTLTPREMNGFLDWRRVRLNV